MTFTPSIAEEENIAPNSTHERECVYYAKTFWEYLIGLALRDDFDGAMVFTYRKPVNLIVHTVGMKFSLDIECFDEKNEIIREVKDMRPWQFMYVKDVKKLVEREHVEEAI